MSTGNNPIIKNKNFQTMNYPMHIINKALAKVAKVQVGTHIASGHGTLVVTEIKEDRFEGYILSVYEKLGRKTNTSLPFSRFMNGHYRDRLRIIEN